MSRKSESVRAEDAALPDISAPEAKKEIQEVEISTLKSHPLQSQVFRDLTGKQLQDLADDIQKHGLREPIEILPDRTIVCGHQRVAAFTLLERTHIPACINHELAQAGPHAIEQRFLTDNVNRRQLDVLEQARCYERIVALEENNPLELMRRHANERLRDKIGKALGLSGRTLARYVRVLRAPLEVQEAFRHKALTLVSAEAVAGLEEDAQKEIARRIREGINPIVAVSEATANKRKGVVRNVDPVTRFVRSIKAALKRLGEWKGCYLTDEEVETLEEAKSVIGEIIEPTTEGN